MVIRISALSLALAVCLGHEAFAGEVLGWRRDGSGRYEDVSPPTRWSAEEHVVWKTELPGGGYGSPIVVGERIFVVSQPAELLCIRADDGKILWRRSHGHVELYGEEEGRRIEERFARLQEKHRALRREYGELRKAEPEAKEKLEALQERIEADEQAIRDEGKLHAPPPTNGGAGNAAATPVCDGKHVYAAFGHGVVSCHTLEGERRWMKFVEASRLGFGHASSPVLADGKLVVHFEDLVALDAAGGSELWRAELPARHATPAVVQIGGRTALFTPGGALVDAADGRVLAEQLCNLSECSPLVHEGVVYAQGSKTRALRLPERLEQPAELKLLWEADAARGRRTPSPVYHDGLLYGVVTSGILDVTDAETGDSVYRRRLSDVKNVYSSATAAGGHIYISDTRGTTIVLKPGRVYEELARNQIEGFGSSPVFVGKRLYIRAQRHLYCIGE